MDADQTRPPLIKRRLWLAAVSVFSYLLVTAFSMAFWANPESQIIIDHFTAVIALPMAAALAFILVTLMPAGYGAIEFEALGIKLKGASGPIVLWIICFVVIVAAIKLLW